MMFNHARKMHLKRCLAGWVAILLFTFSTGALAQSGYYVVPWLGVEQAYDDNLFFDTEDEQSDWYTRLSPRLEAGFDSETLDWLLSFQNDAEWYHDFSELDSSTARQFGLGTIQYDVNRRLTLTGDAEYVKTNTAEDISLIPGGGIPGSLGRAEAERLFFASGADYLFTPELSGGLLVSWVDDTLIGVSGNETLYAGADLEHILTPVRSILYGYRYRHYDFENQTGTEPVIVVSQTEESNTAWVGLSQILTETTVLDVRAGPRISDGDLEPYFLFSLSREYARGSASIDAVWDETTLLGEAGILESRSVQLTWRHEFTKAFDVATSAGYANLRGTDFTSDITYLNVFGYYRFSPAIFLTARYQFNAQDGDPIDLPTGRVTQNVLSLAITFTRPRRDSGGT